jgi:hypothetical protein
MVKAGFYGKNQVQRWKCQQCGKRFSEPPNTENYISKIRWATVPGQFDVSTDAFQPYENAIDARLYDRASHSQVVKLFSNRPGFTK